MSKIDERSSVPVTWLAILLLFAASGVWTTAFWVKGVNDGMKQFDGRVARIEHALHIDTTDEVDLGNPNPFVNQAEAWTNRKPNSQSERKRDN